MKQVKNGKIYLLLLLIIIILSSLTLNSSPFFEGMQGNDSSVFQILGKGVFNSQIMYKDLFDHKGPIVYFINSIASLINGQIGLFIVEIILIWIGTIYVYKSANIFLNKKGSFLSTVLYLMLLFTTIWGGNYTEEYAMNITNIAAYYILRILYLKDDKKKNWIIIGITFALNFFIKPTYIPIWIAFGITKIIVCVKNKTIKKLLKQILYAIFGVLIIGIPILIYLIINNNCKDFIEAYFLMNFKYSGSTILEKIQSFVLLIYVYKYYIFLIFVFGINIIMIFSRKIEKKIKVFINLYLLITIFFSALAANAYHHYLIQFANCIVLEFTFIFYVIKEKFKNNKISHVYNQLPKKMLYVCLILTILLFTAIKGVNNNGIFSGFAKYGKQIRKYKVEIESCMKNDDKMLVIGNAPEYYILLNKQPDFKYFFQTPIFKYDENIVKETEKYIEEKKPKLIILNSGNYNGREEKEFYKKIAIIIEKLYFKSNNQNIEYYILKENV